MSVHEVETEVGERNDRFFAANRNKKLRYRIDCARRRSLRRSRSFKVTDISTNHKPIGDFLLVNTNLYPISHRFPVIAQYWSDCRL